MAIKRIVRVNELIKREIADDLIKLLGRTELNPATVMVSRVETSPDIKKANVFLSIIGDPGYQKKALRIIEKLRAELQHDINKVSSFKFTPRLNFCLDHSIQEGNHILELIADIEEDHPEWLNEEPNDEHYGEEE